MITNVQKNEIIQLIEAEKMRLGSYKAVAVKCKVSETTVSQLLSGTYLAKGDDMYLKIALALGYEFDEGRWNIATDVTNFRIIAEVLNDAKEESMFIGISEKAGSGKTATADIYLSQNKSKGVFKLNCKEWSGRIFLLELAREIGSEIPKGYASVNDLIENIADTIKKIAYARPLIILDQANSLKPSALRTLIHLFNECEDILGVVIIGTDNLECEIKRGVRLNKTGYDELDSRFGRKYIHLIGATLKDTRKICEVNGITDPKLQEQIFKDAEPGYHTLEDGTQIGVIKDKRRLKRIIKRERLKINTYGN
jgi:DNA transposition AAA+ family ATPase